MRPSPRNAKFKTTENQSQVFALNPRPPNLPSNSFPVVVYDLPEVLNEQYSPNPIQILHIEHQKLKHDNYGASVFDGLNFKIYEANLSIAAAEADMTAIADKNGHFRNEINRLSVALSEERSALRENTVNIDILKKENKTLARQNNTLKVSLSETSVKVEAARAQLKAANADSNGANQVKEQHEANKKKLTDENLMLEGRIKDLETSLRDAYVSHTSAIAQKEAQAEKLSRRWDSIHQVTVQIKEDLVQLQEQRFAQESKIAKEKLSGVTAESQAKKKAAEHAITQIRTLFENKAVGVLHDESIKSKQSLSHPHENDSGRTEVSHQRSDNLSFIESKLAGLESIMRWDMEFRAQERMMGKAAGTWPVPPLHPFDRSTDRDRATQDEIEQLKTKIALLEEVLTARAVDPTPPAEVPEPEEEEIDVLEELAAMDRSHQEMAEAVLSHESTLMAHADWQEQVVAEFSEVYALKEQVIDLKSSLEINAQDVDHIDREMGDVVEDMKAMQIRVAEALNVQAELEERITAIEVASKSREDQSELKNDVDEDAQADPDGELMAILRDKEKMNFINASQQKMVQEKIDSYMEQHLYPHLSDIIAEHVNSLTEAEAIDYSEDGGDESHIRTRTESGDVSGVSNFLECLRPSHGILWGRQQ